MDPIAQFKENARAGWASFTPFEMITGTAAPHLVRFAAVARGARASPTSTWPPELFTGRMFALTGKYGPPLPPGVSPPVQWGDPNVVRERLGANAKSITFDRAQMRSPTLSPAHMRLMMEVNVGPMSKLVAALGASDPAKLASFRGELEALTAEYFEDNVLRQDFLMTRAIKA